MKKKLAILLLMLIALAGASLGYVVGGLQAYARYQQASLTGPQHCGGRLPVRICVRAPQVLFTAFYPFYVHNGSPVVEVFYSSLAGRQRLQVGVSIAGFSQLQRRTVTATSATQSSPFVPPLAPDALRSLVTDRQTLLQVSVSDLQGKRYYTNAIPLLLHSRQLMQWTAANRLLIAAWVTPADAHVQALVSAASAYLGEQPAPAPTALVGYRAAFLRQVLDQVDALFDALRLTYHLRCVGQGVPYRGADSGGATTQTISLPAETLQRGSGQDIELSLLLASAAENIGLYPALVILPDRVLLGVALEPDGQEYGYWDVSTLNKGLSGDAANIAGDALYAQNVKQGSVLDKILIGDARRAGVEPML
jgi:hypothetical protein